MLHPYFRFDWFKDRSDDRLEQAKVLFQYVFDVYYKTCPETAVPISEPQAPTSDFLEEVGIVRSRPSASLPARSEIERWTAGEGGYGKQYDNPLLWWKVCIHDCHIGAVLT